MLQIGDWVAAQIHEADAGRETAQPNASNQGRTGTSARFGDGLIRDPIHRHRIAVIDRNGGQAVSRWLRSRNAYGGHLEVDDGKAFSFSEANRITGTSNFARLGKRDHYVV